MNLILQLRNPIDALGGMLVIIILSIILAFILWRLLG